MMSSYFENYTDRPTNYWDESTLILLNYDGIFVKMRPVNIHVNEYLTF